MDTSALQHDYEQIRPKAERLRVALMSEITHLLDANDVTLGVPMESRTKSWSSLEEKLVRKNTTLVRVSELDDLVGIRIILLFRKDVDAIQALIEKSLKVLSSEDVASRLNETQFGYQSKHLVVTTPDSWLKLPSYSNLGGIKVEIQIRTLAQHIWAAASHKLQYKHEASVPAPLRRSIHRASALLETIDIEFDRLLNERQQYLHEELPSAPANQALNVESLRTTLSSILPEQNRGPTEQYDDVLFDLNYFGVDSPEKLQRMLTAHFDAILASDKSHSKKNRKGFYFTHVGLAREGLRKEFGDKIVNNYFLKIRKELRTPLPRQRVKRKPTTTQPKSAT